MPRATLRRLVELFVRTGRWSRQLLGQLFGSAPRRSAGRSFRPRLELLEARDVPSVSFSSQTFGTPPYPYTTVLADMNGDGKADLVSGSVGTNSVAVMLNGTPAKSATASFGGAQQFNFGFSPGYIAVGDINGDGKEDIVAVNNNLAAVLLNTTPTGSSTVTFSAAQSLTVPVGASLQNVALSDLDGDGKPM
jgi:hypothetical protein